MGQILSLLGDLQKYNGQGVMYLVYAVLCRNRCW